MIKYLGSKRRLVEVIAAAVAELPVAGVCDAFAGTTRVGQRLRRAGLRVVSNDVAAYSEVFGHAYIGAGPDTDRPRLRRLIEELNRLPGVDGYVTETFCRGARFLHPANGRRIDAIRDRIDRLDLDPTERGLLLTSLIEAADRVDSTCGVQMAFLKSWAPRALRPLELREPAAVEGPAGEISRVDALDLPARLRGVDCVYLDPPYNQHSYLANYHVWETIVRNDRPAHYGLARKRLDTRARASVFNSRRRSLAALAALVDALPVRWIVMSFSDEGFHDLAAIRGLLAGRGHVGELAVGARRYVGAQIGIHNPAGERVGRVSHLHHTEMMFVAGPDAAAVRRAVASARRLAGPRARTGSAGSRASGTRAASSAGGAASARRGTARA
ncbi:MAG TPA: DNA adenine methylase [Gaiellales bacterium]|nr:DNA adenine methylase [Gaiellales bacterium]